MTRSANRLLTCCLLATLAAPAAAQAVAGPPVPVPPPTPARFVPGAPTWIASPGMVLDVTTGVVYIPNGSENLPSSSMLGWQQGGCKAQDTIAGVLQCLTDLQIDVLY